MKKLAYIFVVLLVGLTACEKKQEMDLTKILENDHLMVQEILKLDTTRLFEIQDSLIAIGELTKLEAAEYKGQTYAQLYKLGEAERWFRYAIDSCVPTYWKDSVSRLACVSGLVQILGLRRDHDAVLQIALPMIEELKTLNMPEDFRASASGSEMMLHLYLGTSQSYLGKKKDAAESFDNSYRAILKQVEADTSWVGPFNCAMCAKNVAFVYETNKEYEKAAVWLARTDTMLQKMLNHGTAPAYYVDNVRGFALIGHAMVAMGLNNTKEADKYFKEFEKTEYSKSNTGRVKAAVYLKRAKKYAKSAEYFEALDDFIAEMRMEPSVDYFYMMQDKYEANLKSGRIDSTLAAGTAALNYVDSAITRLKESEAAKFAAIYETKKKDEEIARQQIGLNRQRFLALAVALVLITAFFIVYTLFRRRAAKRMAEMKAQQERIESELRIARDIQMSMVPNTFPEYEGLDLYAQMTPAKEVGGDLYGYVINGHHLYFAVGDVSGKGVPASLFMAQATRLFRTMANQGLMPAEICNHMNAELSGEDNVSGMFVTMFIGMMDMESGHLNYCNAGHNPPVIGGGDNQGDFLQMEANAPIGLFPDMDYQGEEMESIKGRALFIYTDGLNEAEDTEQHQFGEERLLEILRDTHFDTAKQVVETLTERVEEHRAGAEPNDDMTMLCLRVS